jgi:hypothetical protein
MADATDWPTSEMVDNELSSLTTARIPMLGSAISRARAARRVVSLIKGSGTAVPAAADAPTEWQALAVEWLAATAYERFPEYFRAKFPTIEDVEKRIVRAARIEPAENITYAASSGTVDTSYDYTSCGGGEIGGILP